jgi:hypothetical protein
MLKFCRNHIWLGHSFIFNVFKVVVVWSRSVIQEKGGCEQSPMSHGWVISSFSLNDAQQRPKENSWPKDLKWITIELTQIELIWLEEYSTRKGSCAIWSNKGTKTLCWFELLKHQQFDQILKIETLHVMDPMPCVNINHPNYCAHIVIFQSYKNIVFKGWTHCVALFI